MLFFLKLIIFYHTSLFNTRTQYVHSGKRHEMCISERTLDDKLVDDLIAAAGVVYTARVIAKVRQLSISNY